VIERDLGINVRGLNVGGASSSLGTGLFMLLGATLYPHHELVMNYFDMDSLFENTESHGADDQNPVRGKPASLRHAVPRQY
jgi:glycerate kinase